MIRTSLLLLLSFCIVENLLSQHRDPDGGAPIEFEHTECLAESDRKEIQNKLSHNISVLQEQQLVPKSFLRSSLVQFEFPMKWNQGFNDYGFHMVANFVDHNQSYPGQIQDYNCGPRSYDTQSGYNHRGIDYVLWPFSWNMVETEAVQVIAAAPGVIIGKDDGNDHYSCVFSSENWNAVYLLHADGSTTWYGHMKKNSLTSKAVGQSVEAGEFLGIVASSGNSSAPHLHFEVYDASGSLIDPFAGTCNDLNAESWWLDQRPYIDPAINKIQTHFAPPEFQPCPQEAVINDSDQFTGGDQVFFATYFKDQTDFHVAEFSILDPAGNVFDAWTFTSPEPHYEASYWYWTAILPFDAPEGTWTFQSEFAGNLYVHHFEVENGISAIDENEFFKQINIYQQDRSIMVDINALVPISGEIYLSDITGRLVTNQSVEVLSGKQTITFENASVSPGIYFLSMRNNQGVFFSRKILLH